MPKGKRILKLSLMVVVFEAPVADVWFTRGNATPMCPLRRSCALADFDRTVTAVKSKRSVTSLRPMIRPLCVAIS
jgi:hypothetical protein